MRLSLFVLAAAGVATAVVIVGAVAYALAVSNDDSQAPAVRNQPISTPSPSPTVAPTVAPTVPPRPTPLPLLPMPTSSLPQPTDADAEIGRASCRGRVKTS